MPETVAELYVSASDAMLACGGVVSEEMRTLLEAVLFEAHVAQTRVIGEMQLVRAALAVFAPQGTLAELEAKHRVNAQPAFQRAVDSLPSEAREALEAAGLDAGYVYDVDAACV